MTASILLIIPTIAQTIGGYIVFNSKELESLKNELKVKSMDLANHDKEIEGFQKEREKLKTKVNKANELLL